MSNRRTAKVEVKHIITNGKNRYAGIQYRGQNLTLVEGDSVDGGEIVSIMRDGVILLKNNQEKFIQILTPLLDESITTSSKE